MQKTTNSDLNDREDFAKPETDAERDQFIKAFREATLSVKEQQKLREAERAKMENMAILKTFNTDKDLLDANDKINSAQARELRTYTALQRDKLDQLKYQHPEKDLFGLTRGSCQACGPEKCSGYRPQGTVCPSPNSELDFPTFCVNCGCPCSFHKIQEEDASLPEPMARNLTAYELTSNDINFNAVLVVLEVRDPALLAKNTGMLVSYLRAEGLEILSLETRSLDIQEALLLRVRQLKQQQQGVTAIASRGFDAEARRRQGIHPTEEFQAAASQELGQLDRIAMQTEQAIRRAATRVAGPGKTQDGGARGQGMGGVDMGTLAFQPLDDSGAQALLKEPSLPIAPRKPAKSFKVTNSTAPKAAKSLAPARGAKSTVYGAHELAASMDRSVHLRELVTNQYVILTLSSVCHQNLESKMKDEMLPGYYRLIGGHNHNYCSIKTTYLSGNTIESFEDTVLFAPQLYRLQKSTILAEPIESFFAREGAAASKGQQPGGAALEPVAPVRKAQTVLPKEPEPQFGRNRQLTMLLKSRALKQLGREGVSRSDTLALEAGDETADRLQSLLRDNEFQSSDPARNKVLKNFGTMQDFFDYSGVFVQNAKKAVDVRSPAGYGCLLLPGQDLELRYAALAGDEMRYSGKLVNLFAIAKVGSPNMVFPNTLDVQIKNFQDQHQYLQVADYFFPENARSQYTVIVLKPLIVQNGLNNLFVEILRANEFRLLKRKVRKLSEQEAAYLCRLEKVQKENMALYIKLVMAGPCEIVVLSKVGAVQDAVTLCHGSETGRRRSNQTGDESGSSRGNVDSLSAMFEIAPFSSFNEILDLEDFLLRHSRVSKLGRGDNTNALVVQKKEEVRSELNAFQRCFNIAAVAAPSEKEALRLMSMLAPRVAQLEQLFLVLNPQYNYLKEKAEELLCRMQQKLIGRGAKRLTPELAEKLLGDKFGQSPEGKDLIRKCAGQEVHIYHVTKVAAARELKSIYAQSDAGIEDHLEPSEFMTSYKGSFLPHCLPYLFLYMDSEAMAESARGLLYGLSQTVFSGSDFRTRISAMDTNQILETILFTNTGESVLKVVTGDDGELVPASSLALKRAARYINASVSNNCLEDGARYDLGRTAAWVEKFQRRMMMAETVQNDSSVRFVVEGTTHTLFEIRFHKINHRGDLSLAGFEVDAAAFDDDGGSEDEQPQGGNPAGKSVKFAEAFDAEATAEGERRKQIRQESLFFFQRFAATNFFYQQVARVVGPGYTPTFYRYKVLPLDGSPLNRVYEVEEHVGEVFLEAAAKMHIESVAQANGRQPKRDLESLLRGTETGDQMSLPAFLLGRQLAQMCKKLEKVKCADQSLLQGAGEMVYDVDEHVLRGQTRNIKSFYYDDQARYTQMLETMQYRWHLYMSNLETDIIETKLSLILDSLTFKYTRQPEMLALVPDRITEFNLRVNKTIKISTGYGQLPRDSAASDAGDGEEQQPFKEVYGAPDRAKDLEELFGSVMDYFDRLADQQKQILSSHAGQGAGETKGKATEKRGASRGGSASRQPGTQERTAKRARPNVGHDSRFTLHKHVAVAACEVAKRPKHHLVAGILYLINFWLRKIHRRQELMHDAVQEKRPARGGADAERDFQRARRSKVELEYDKLLTAITQGLIQNYGNDEYNHVLDLVRLQRGHESAFEQVLQQRRKKAEEKQARRAERAEREARRRRKEHGAKSAAQYNFWEVDLACGSCGHANKPEAAFCSRCGGRLEAPPRDPSPRGDGDDEEFQALITDQKQFKSRKKKGGGNQDSDSEGPTPEQQAVANFLGQKFALTDAAHSSEFRQIQEYSKGDRLGPQHVALAREYALTAKMENENKKNKRNGIQEKISFVRMEYFLYAFSEASRVMGELNKIGKQLKQIDKMIEEKGQEIKALTKKLQFSQNTVRHDLQSANLAIRQQQNRLEKEIDDLEHRGKDECHNTMASREAELKTIFKELVACDIHAPKGYFDGDVLLKQQGTGAQTKSQPTEEYTVPLQTFWIPLVEHEYNVDPQDEEFQKKHKGAFTRQERPKEYKFAGTFLPRDLQVEKAEMAEAHALNREQDERPGASLLRPIKKQELPDELTFAGLIPEGNDKEREYLAAVTQEVQVRLQAKKTKRPKDFLEDPFVYVRNKEKANDVVESAIEAFFSHNPKVYGNSGLSEDECKQLTRQAFKALKKAEVIHEEYQELNFRTSFEIYKDISMNQVERTQLANFVKSVGDL